MMPAPLDRAYLQNYANVQRARIIDELFAHIRHGVLHAAANERYEFSFEITVGPRPAPNQPVAFYELMQMHPNYRISPCELADFTRRNFPNCEVKLVTQVDRKVTFSLEEILTRTFIQVEWKL